MLYLKLDSLWRLGESGRYPPTNSSQHSPDPLKEIMAVVTGLNFAGRTEEALNLYREVLDAEILFLMRFRECPDKSLIHPGNEEMIFHATFRIDGTEFKASDVGYSENASIPELKGFSLVLRPTSVEKAKQMFAALSVGGEVIIPFGESTFTDWYGIVIDKIGVTWKLNIENSG